MIACMFGLFCIWYWLLVYVIAIGMFCLFRIVY